MRLVRQFLSLILISLCFESLDLRYKNLIDVSLTVLSVLRYSRWHPGWLLERKIYTDNLCLNTAIFRTAKILLNNV